MTPQEVPRGKPHQPPGSPFFVVGCGRSGTTLLRTMLNHHPQIAIPVESLFIVDYLRASPSVPVTALARMLVNDYEFREWGLSLTLADLEGCASARDLINRIHELYVAQQGKLFWGQKTPRFIRHAELLKSFYPDARFIHVLRDPRAVVSSLIRSNLHRSNAYYAARRWIKDVQAGLALKQACPDDVLEVRYEGLVASPSDTLEQVCAFIGVDFHPDMLTYHQRGMAEYSPIFGRIHARLSQPPQQDRIEAWRASLSARQLRLVESLCAETMRSVGYTLVTEVGAPDRAYIACMKAQRLWGLSRQFLQRITHYFRPQLSFFWRKLRLGVLWQDLAEVNY